MCRANNVYLQLNRECKRKGLILAERALAGTKARSLSKIWCGIHSSTGKGYTTKGTSSRHQTVHVYAKQDFEHTVRSNTWLHNKLGYPGTGLTSRVLFPNIIKSQLCLESVITTPLKKDNNLFATYLVIHLIMHIAMIMAVSISIPERYRLHFSFSNATRLALAGALATSLPQPGRGSGLPQVFLFPWSAVL